MQPAILIAAGDGHTNSQSPQPSDPEPESNPPQQTFPTTIPTHPSTIQYIPVLPNPPSPNPVNLRTIHIIPAEKNSSEPIQYQYVASGSSERGTLHYPPNSIHIIQTVPSLIMSNSILATIDTKNQTDSRNNLLHIITSQPTGTIRNVQLVRNESSSAGTEGAKTNITASSTNNSVSTSPPLSDQQIRVLTPSEIMRTLPSLGQETYDPVVSVLLHVLGNYFLWIFCLFILSLLLFFKLSYILFIFFSIIPATVIHASKPVNYFSI
jgi:hypothetical protein